jgi:hypothetical protein
MTSVLGDAHEIEITGALTHVAALDDSPCWTSPTPSSWMPSTRATTTSSPAGVPVVDQIRQVSTTRSMTIIVVGEH